MSKISQLHLSQGGVDFIGAAQYFLADMSPKKWFFYTLPSFTIKKSNKVDKMHLVAKRSNKSEKNISFFLKVSFSYNKTEKQTLEQFIYFLKLFLHFKTIFTG